MPTEKLHNENDQPGRDELYRSLNSGILTERLYTFQANIRRNSELIKKFGGLATVVHSFQKKHIIIAAAGESLKDSYPLLRKIQHRDDVCIIAVDMAYAPLARHGITPHFAISCETSPRLFFEGHETKDSTLLAFSASHPSTVRSWKGPLAFYNWMIREEPYETLWKEAGEDLGYVATGSIVTTQALSLVIGLGPSSILLCGNDLGFSDLPYSNEASWYDVVRPLTNRYFPLESLCRNSMRKARHYEIKRGEKSFFTNNQFLGAKYWMEEVLAQSRYRLFDMSETGLSGKLVEKITPKRYERDVLASVRKKRKRR